jgi:HD superfamily phosphohydrolase
MNEQVYDPIHGIIELTPLLQSIIYTWEFNRLYDLYQMGAVYLVYPSAVHKRSEHSIGVSHLAGIMATTLSKCEDLDCDEDGRLCIQFDRDYPDSTGKSAAPRSTVLDQYYIEKGRFVELCRVAGLVHDIGHGPYSHLYDSHVKLDLEPNHEERGVAIFKKMCSDYSLKLTHTEIRIIQTMVAPCSRLANFWYYQIVANKSCDIDVDKIDYIQRDAFHIGLGYGGEWSRILKNCKVRKYPVKCVKAGDRLCETIVWPCELKDDIFNLFATRYRLYKHVCTHQTVKAYEFVIVDMLKAVIRGTDNFSLLSDSIITCRMNSCITQLQMAIARKQIPVLIDERVVRENKAMDRIYPCTEEPDLIIDRFEIGLSKEAWNPLNRVIYEYCNGNVETNQDSRSLGISVPGVHKETIMRVYKCSGGPIITSDITNADAFWKRFDTLDNAGDTPVDDEI